MTHVLLVDNYDSFTWNLVQAFAGQGARVTVRRNDEITPDEARAIAPTHLVLSPGPGGPAEAGQCGPVADALAGRVPVLGVCLGLQVLVERAGGRIDRTAPVHGKATRIHHDGQGLFAGLPQPLPVGRYHSLVATVVPEVFAVSARTDDGLVMAVRHRYQPTVAVQFHPESVLTPDGDALLGRFLALAQSDGGSGQS